MKKLLKLYKMFYRLLRLKHWQRLEIQNHEKFICRLQIEKCIKEFFDLKIIFNDYREVMLMHKIYSPSELFRALENKPVKEGLTRTEFVALREKLEHFANDTFKEGHPRFGCASELNVNDEMEDVSDLAKDAAKKLTGAI